VTKFYFLIIHINFKHKVHSNKQPLACSFWHQ